MSEAVSKRRIDAEYYHPEKAHIQSHLSALLGKTIGEYFVPIREIYTPDTSDDAIVLNFDLTDALNPILTESVQMVIAGELGSSKKQFKKGDIVISRLRSYLKEIAIVDTETNRKVLGSSEFIVLCPKSNVRSELMLAYLHTNAVQTILKWSQDGSNHPRFQEDELLSIKLPDMVIGQQDKIKDLTRQAIKSYRQSLQLYAEAERLLADELGLDRLDLSESLFNVRRVSDVLSSSRMDAEHYRQKYYRVLESLENIGAKEVVPLQRIVTTLTNGHTPLHHDLDVGDIPFLTAEHVYDFWLDYDNARRIWKEHHETEVKRTQLRDNDVLITIKGRVGNAAVVEHLPGDANINQDVALLRLKPGIHPYYVVGFLNSPAGKALMEQIATGQINPFLGLGNLARVRIPIFDEKRMNAIGENIRQTVNKSYQAKEDAKRLLAEAKSEVERMIEIAGVCPLK